MNSEYPSDSLKVTIDCFCLTRNSTYIGIESNDYMYSWIFIEITRSSMYDINSIDVVTTWAVDYYPYNCQVVGICP